MHPVDIRFCHQYITIWDPSDASSTLYTHLPSFQTSLSFNPPPSIDHVGIRSPPHARCNAWMRSVPIPTISRCNAAPFVPHLTIPNPSVRRCEASGRTLQRPSSSTSPLSPSHFQSSQRILFKSTAPRRGKALGYLRIDPSGWGRRHRCSCLDGLDPRHRKKILRWRSGSEVGKGNEDRDGYRYFRSRSRRVP